MFEELEMINERPEPFQFYTASDLWTDEHTSAQTLSYHLNEAIDLSSRNPQFINRSVEWIASRFNIVTDRVNGATDDRSNEATKTSPFYLLDVVNYLSILVVFSASFLLLRGNGFGAR